MSGEHSRGYRILVSRADRRPMADLYGFGLQQLIPPFPVPLLPGEKEPILELQPLLNRVYEKGRYHLAIDYGQPPVPPLSETDQSWAKTHLFCRTKKEKGRTKTLSPFALRSSLFALLRTVYALHSSFFFLLDRLGQTNLVVVVGRCTA
jgi:hypothetical protein